MKKLLSALSMALALSIAAITPAHAALDFTALTAAVDATTIVGGLTAIAAIKMLPGVARWGFNQVISWFH